MSMTPSLTRPTLLESQDINVTTNRKNKFFTDTNYSNL